MFRIAVFFIFFTGSIHQGNSQKYEEIQMETNVISKLDADKAWHKIQEWSNLNKRVPDIVASTSVIGEGMNSSWQIDLVNGSKIIEKMIYFDSAERTLSYVMTETPMPIIDYVAIMKVETYGIKKSLISFYTECKVMDADKEKMMNDFKAFQKTYLSNF